MEETWEHHDRALGDIKNFMRDLSEITKDVDSLSIRDMETSYNMKGEIFDHMK